MLKSKVFIGPQEIANLAKSFSDALRTQNIYADFVTYSTSSHPFGYKADKILYLFKKPPVKGLNRLLRLFYFIEMLFKYNTFVFLSPKSLLGNNIDLPVLRAFRKKIVFIFTGCSERPPDFDIDNPNFICNRCKDDNWKKMFHCKDIPKKKAIIHNLEKYSDYILSQSDSAGYLEKIEPSWLHITTANPPEKDYLKKFEEKIITITHLPSNPLLKQSHIIIPVLKKISGLPGTNVIIKDGIWERNKLLEVLDKTHILVDAIGLGYGMLGVEGMSRGCVVLNSCDEWFRKQVPEAPIYSTSAETLYDDLIFLLKNLNVMKDYARKSIHFFKKYHSPEAAGKYYKEKLNLC